jgi:hypothetical protein
MKKYIIVMSILFIFISPYAALSSDHGFIASDFPDLPDMPFQGNNVGYVMDFMPYSVNPHWFLNYVSDMSSVVIKNYSGTKNELYYPSGIQIKQYRADIKFDNVLKIWYIDDFKFIADRTGNMAGGIEKMVYWSHDLYTEHGNLFTNANPFPQPPVVLAELAGVSLQQIPLLIGGTAQEVLPLGLRVLAIILVISLVVWLLRSFLLHRQ